MSTELVVLKDRTRPGDTITLEYVCGNIELLVSYAWKGKTRFLRFQVDERQLPGFIEVLTKIQEEEAAAPPWQVVGPFGSRIRVWNDA